MIDLGALKASIVLDDKEATQKLKNFGDESEKSSSKLKTFLTEAGNKAKTAVVGLTTAIVGASTAMAVKGVFSADEFNGAVSKLAVQTGATSDEMDSLGESMKNIYTNNLGESFEDIAESMATVKTQTGLVGEELESATSNAILLRDAFGFEVAESTRAVNQLMKEFGVTADEAYTLLVQGSQEGLNANGDLMDVVSEYSVHFRQLGIDSEQMFNMLKNGADTGTFSVDKLGDAVKEFGIRAKVLDDSGEALETLGFNAEEMVAKFNKGGEEANQAFQEVNKALLECNDTTLQNTLGVKLYGTMWEDLGIDAIAALANMNGEFDKTKDSLDEMNKMKFDTFGKAMEGIKRQLEVSVFIPIGEKLLPLLNKFADFIEINMPTIQKISETVFSAMEKVIIYVIKKMDELYPIFEKFAKWISDNMPTIKEITDTTFDAMTKAIGFVVDNLDILIPLLAGAVAGIVAFNVINTAVTLFNTLKTTLTTVSTAQGILNAVMAANPIGLVCTAIGLLVAAGVALCMNWDTVKEKCGELWTALSKWFGDIKEDFDNMWQNIKNFGSDFFNAGYDLFNSLWDGIKSVWSNISNWVNEKVSWISDKLTFWNNSKSKMSDGINGSHRTGKREVPFDGYIAELHKGEMVLTQAEANRYRDNQAQTQQVTNVFDTSILEDKLDRLTRTVSNIVRQQQIANNMA